MVLQRKCSFVRVSVDVCSYTFYLVGLTAEEIYSTEQVVAGQLQREEWHGDWWGHGQTPLARRHPRLPWQRGEYNLLYLMLVKYLLSVNFTLIVTCRNSRMDSIHLVGTLAWNSEIYTDPDPKLRYEGSLKTLYTGWFRQYSNLSFRRLFRKLKIEKIFFGYSINMINGCRFLWIWRFTFFIWKWGVALGRFFKFCYRPYVQGIKICCVG